MERKIKWMPENSLSASKSVGYEGNWWEWLSEESETSAFCDKATRFLSYHSDFIYQKGSVVNPGACKPDLHPYFYRLG